MIEVTVTARQSQMLREIGTRPTTPRYGDVNAASMKVQRTAVTRVSAIASVTVSSCAFRTRASALRCTRSCFAKPTNPSPGINLNSLLGFRDGKRRLLKFAENGAFRDTENAIPCATLHCAGACGAGKLSLTSESALD